MRKIMPRQEEIYKSEIIIEEGRRNAVPASFLERYARALHEKPEVVANLKFAHEVDAADYSLEDFLAISDKLKALMHYMAKTAPEDLQYLSKISSTSDFNHWYLQEVVYGGKKFDEALDRYLKLSPYVASKDQP